MKVAALLSIQTLHSGPRYVGEDACEAMEVRLTRPHLKMGRGVRDTLEGMGHVIETHISLVVLIGELAYKLKKHVNLEFLDFSTLEQRQLGSPLYLDVVKLVDDTSPAFVPLTDPRPALDVAVMMRRFDTEQQLDVLASKGLLSEHIILELAVKVADAHAKARTTPQFGSTASIKQVCRQNFEQLANLNDKVQGCIGELRRWTESSITALETVLEQRRKEGRIRACHGDLHLANIAMHKGDVVMFDCIEFNESFYSIDVMSDVAFLLMDLEEHRQYEMATAFLNQYLAQTGDYSGLRVLVFYKVFRAIVRAKVALMAAANDTSSSLLEQAQHYFELAHSYTLPCTNSLYIMHGVSGSGKSWLAHRLANVSGSIHLRSDVERKRLFGLRPHESSHGTIYTQEATTRTMAHLDTLARLCLSCGHSVILDSTCLDPSTQSRFLAIGADTGANVVLLHCTAPLDVIRSRLCCRRGDASEATAAQLERQLPLSRPPSGSAVVDTSSSAAVKKVLDGASRDSQAWVSVRTASGVGRVQPGTQ